FPGDDVDGACPVDVGDGQRCRRYGGGERARGGQGEDAGRFVEVEAIHRVQIADDQLEVTVAVDVGQRHGGRRVHFATDVGPAGEPEPGMAGIESLVDVQAVLRAVVADDQVGETVAGDVAERERRGGELIGRDVLRAS